MVQQRSKAGPIAQGRGAARVAEEVRLQELEPPLRVWAGHPFKVCKRPLSGVVSREAAAKLMEDYAHKDCLDKDSGLGLGAWLLGGGIALAALSQVQKRS